MLLFISTFVCICLFITKINGQSCYTPHYETGICVSVYDCPNVLEYIQPPITQEITDYLRSLQCESGSGRFPHVCCTSAAPPRAQTTQRPTTWQWPRPESGPAFGNAGGAFGGGGGFSTGTGNILPTEGNCGHTALNDRILGGEDAALDDYPWMALLEYKKAGNFNGERRKLSCGGALINPRYVLTAAHCLVGEIESKVGTLVGVRLGEYDTTRDLDCIGSICADPVLNMGIEAVIPHEGYNEKSKNRANDIGLVRMNGEVQYSDFIRPICLPSMVTYTRAAPNAKWVSVGWGRTLKERQSSIKQRVDLPVVDQASCAAKYNTLGIDILDAQVCAGGKYGQDTCDGDSGNPLMRTSNNFWVVEGIVSFGRACGLEEWPAVYTRVTSYDNWIKYNLRP